jgi:hypothetical protein
MPDPHPHTRVSTPNAPRRLTQAGAVSAAGSSADLEAGSSVTSDDELSVRDGVKGGRPTVQDVGVPPAQPHKEQAQKQQQQEEDGEEEVVEEAQQQTRDQDKRLGQAEEERQRAGASGPGQRWLQLLQVGSGARAAEVGRLNQQAAQEGWRGEQQQSQSSGRQQEQQQPQDEQNAQEEAGQHQQLQQRGLPEEQHGRRRGPGGCLGQEQEQPATRAGQQQRDSPASGTCSNERSQQATGAPTTADDGVPSSGLSSGAAESDSAGEGPEAECSIW